MKFYVPGSAASVIVTFPEGIEPYSGTFRILDTEGTVLQTGDTGINRVLSTDPVVSQVTIATQAGTNTLPVGETAAPRVIEFDLVLAGSEHYIHNHYYGLRPNDPLVVGTNTFATMMEAEFLAADLVSHDAWDAGSRDMKVAALIQARGDLCRMTYKYTNGFDNQSTMYDAISFFSTRLRNFDAAQLATLPTDFIAALKRAQVIQANYLLDGDSIEAQLANGLFSRTVGESSEMWRAGMGKVKQPICSAAMAALAGYLEVGGEWMIGRC